RRPVAVAASIVVLALVVPSTLYLVRAPRVADQGEPQDYTRVQEQPRDKVAALSQSAPAASPVPPTRAAPEQLPEPPTITPPVPNPPVPPPTDQIVTRPSYGNQPDHPSTVAMRKEGNVTSMITQEQPPYLLLERPWLRAEPAACEAAKRKGPTESLTD